MKININKEHIKENLKSENKLSTMKEMFFYGVIIGFYPVFLALSAFAAMAYDGKILKGILISTIFYIFMAIATIVIRNKIIKGSYHLFVPEEIYGTRREDYSMISTMMMHGRYGEANAEAIQEFAKKPSIELPLVMGDTLVKYKQYELARNWYQRGVNISEGSKKLYLLERLRELTENHLYDKTRVILYLEKIARGFPNTPAGKEASQRLASYQRTKIL